MRPHVGMGSVQDVRGSGKDEAGSLVQGHDVMREGERGQGAGEVEGG